MDSSHLLRNLEARQGQLCSGVTVTGLQRELQAGHSHVICEGYVRHALRMYYTSNVVKLTLTSFHSSTLIPGHEGGEQRGAIEGEDFEIEDDDEDDLHTGHANAIQDHHISHKQHQQQQLTKSEKKKNRNSKLLRNFGAMFRLGSGGAGSGSKDRGGAGSNKGGGGSMSRDSSSSRNKTTTAGNFIRFKKKGISKRSKNNYFF